MSKRKFYVVLSPNGKEGVLTIDANDALYASTGNQLQCKGLSTLCLAFREAYFEESDDENDALIDSEEPEILEIEVDVP